MLYASGFLEFKYKLHMILFTEFFGMKKQSTSITHGT